MHPAVRMIADLLDRHYAKTKIAYEATKIPYELSRGCKIGFGGKRIRNDEFLWLSSRDWKSRGQSIKADRPIDISCAPAISGAWMYVGELSAIGDDLILKESHRDGSKTELAWNYAAPGCETAILEYVIRVGLEKCKWAGDREVIRLDEEPSSNLGAGC